MNKTLTLFLCFIYSFVYSFNDTTKIRKQVVYDSSHLTVTKIPVDAMNRLLEDSDYSYVETKAPPKTLWERFTEWLDRTMENLLNTDAGNYSMKIIKIAICIVIIVLIIWLLLKNNVRSVFYGKSASAPPLLHEIDGDIHEIDFDKRISEEVAKGDFRKAIRFLFLKIIKELNKNSLINWQMDKTNADYYKELRNTSYGKEFKELSRLYEYIWYGDFKLDESRFKIIIQKFNQFQINKTAK